MDNITRENSEVSGNHQTGTMQQRFSVLLEKHSGIVFKVALTYCWHQDDRAELQQEITTQVWRAFPKYNSEHSFSTWMYRIALNVAISYVRKHSMRKRHFVPYDERDDLRADPRSEISDDPRLEILQQFIEKLDPLNRAVMLLYLEEHSYREIAHIIGISETNVASKISRLKKRIREFSTSQESQGEQHGN